MADVLFFFLFSYYQQSVLNEENNNAAKPVLTCKTLHSKTPEVALLIWMFTVCLGILSDHDMNCVVSSLCYKCRAKRSSNQKPFFWWVRRKLSSSNSLLQSSKDFYSKICHYILLLCHQQAATNPNGKSELKLFFFCLVEWIGTVLQSVVTSIMSLSIHILV